MKHQTDWEAFESNDEFTIGNFYNNYREDFIRWAFKKYGLKRDDAIEIYQQSFFTLLDNIRQNKVKYHKSSVKTYLYGIGKNLISKWLKNRNRYGTFEDYMVANWKEELAIADINEEIMIDKIAKAVERLSPVCKSIIILFFYEQKTLKEIAETLDYQTVETVKSQKYRCKKNLLALVENRNTKQQDS